MTDEELLQRYAMGHGDAMTELYLRLNTGMYSYIYNRVQNSHTAEDIMQDVWSRLILEADRIVDFVGDDVVQFSLQPYLYRMAGNRVIDHYRASRRLKVLGEDEDYLVSTTSRPSQGVIDSEFFHCLDRRMRPLRIKLHEAFWLTRDESMTYEQAAQAMGVAKETVKDWVRQVLKAIRPCREEYEHDGS